jgi:hypothetical protein
MRRRGLLISFAVYAAASFLHYAHNAELLQQYPDMPRWLTRAQIYYVWIALTMLGAVGYRLVRSRYLVAGLLVLGLYGILGLDAISHYALAPFSSHTPSMNATIWAEFASAALFLTVLGHNIQAFRVLARRRQSSPPESAV